MRTVRIAQQAFRLPASTRRRLRMAPVRTALWAVVFTLFLVALLTR